MNSEIVKNWQVFSASVEAWLRENTGAPPIAKPEPLILPPGVIKQFSGADGVAAWDGARNMTTPLQKHSISDALTPSFVQGGPPSMEAEIQPGDPQWTIDARTGQPKRRVEFSWEPWRFPMNEDCWAGGAFLLPSDPMRLNTGASIFQLHNYPHTGVMWNLHVANGRLKSDHRHLDFEFDEPLDAYIDRWCRMVISFRASTEDDGLIKMWLNDKPVLTYRGPTRQDGGEGPYFKHGLYNWGYDRFGDTQKRALVYHDRLRIGVGCGYDAVNPDRW